MKTRHLQIFSIHYLYEFKPDHIYQKLSTLNEKELKSLEHVLGLEF